MVVGCYNVNVWQFTGIYHGVYLTMCIIARYAQRQLVQYVFDLFFNKLYNKSNQWGFSKTTFYTIFSAST